MREKFNIDFVYREVENDNKVVVENKFTATNIFLEKDSENSITITCQSSAEKTEVVFMTIKNSDIKELVKSLLGFI